MDRGVASFNAADAPRTAHVVGSGFERVVATFAERAADRVDRRQIQHVEAQALHILESVSEILERAVFSGRSPRPRKHLIPRAEPGLLAIDPDRPRGIEPGLVAAIGIERHQFAEPGARGGGLPLGGSQ